MRLYTIGFTQTSAQHFFERLEAASVRRVVDIRLHNTNQLAGFAKRDDLAYFLRELAGIEYVHGLALTPTEELLDAYRKHHTPAADFEARYRALLEERRVERTLKRADFEDACLLCTEPSAAHCHRGVAASYLASKWRGVEVVHL